MLNFYITSFLLFWTVAAKAHFGMIIPSNDIINQNSGKKIKLDVSFSHPFEGVGMDMERPNQLMLIGPNIKVNLTKNLRKSKIMGHQGWSCEHIIKRPGVYSFYMIPQPYFEPSEDSYIIHYTKVVIPAFGNEDGWDQELGLKTEIVPLTRPFGLYTHNVFQGIVKLNGKKVPFAEVEVEYYNQNQKAKASNDHMITQVIKADQNGVFTYTPPAAGWWGFAALNTDKQKIKYKGVPKKVELGAVLWVNFIDWKKN